MIRSGSLGKAVLGQSAGAEKITAAGPFAYLDGGTATVNLTVSGTDVYFDAATIDANTALVSLVPSSTDIRTSVDSNTESFKLTPSALEGRIVTDSNTAIVILTPSAYEEKSAGVATAYPVPVHTEGYATFLFGKIGREQKHLRNPTKRPTLPIYDKTNFPQDVITGQVAIATDGSLWVYNGSWNLVAGA